MGNCANKPVTKDGEAPPPEQKAEEVVVESREVVAGEVETKTEVVTEEGTSTEAAAVEADATKEAEAEKVEAEAENK